MYTFLWKIENLSMRFHNHNDFLVSPVFNYKNCLNSLWQLRLYPKGISDQYPGVCILLYLLKIKRAKKIKLNYKLEIQDHSGRIFTCQRFENSFPVGEHTGPFNWFLYEALFKDIKWKDVLTIRCELTSSDAVEDGSCVDGSFGFTNIALQIISFNFELELPHSTKCSVFRTLIINKLHIRIILEVVGESFNIYIKKMEDDPFESKLIVCKFSLLDVKEVETVSRQDAYLFRSGIFPDSWVFESFFTKGQLQDCKETLLKGNVFTLKCEICFSGNSIVSYFQDNKLLHQEHWESESVEASSFQPGLQTLQISKLNRYFDVKLIVDNETFPAHKSVLAANSPLFSKLFARNIPERQMAISLPDIHVGTMGSFLEFFYTRRIKELSYETATELLMLAKRFQVSSLEELCSNFLISVLTESNACCMLKKACVLNCISMKVSAMEYILAHFEGISESETWNNWITTNDDLYKVVVAVQK